MHLKPDRLGAQEFNIEKLQLLEAEKGKIKKEYERREGQIDVKKKMCASALHISRLCRQQLVTLLRSWLPFCSLHAACPGLC